MTEIREAATVMVVRDAPELHVFMLRRNLNSDFVGGAYVFPGGAVDETDRAPELLARCIGRDDAHASRLLGMESGGLGFWVAAIRETFEEAGVLFACDRRTGEPVVGGSEELDVARLAIGRREQAFLDFVEREDLVLDAGALHVFSHWITPQGMPRRYDTWFFVARAPEGHGYAHDDSETVASAWVRPNDAIVAAKRDEFQIIFPTMKNLEAIGRFDAATELLEVTGAASAVDAIEPRIVQDANGIRLLLPGDPGYADAPALSDDALGPLPVEALRGERGS